MRRPARRAPVRAAPEPSSFEVALEPLELEAGGHIDEHRARVWMWSSMEDHAALARGERLAADVPTVFVAPPLTSGAAVGGEEGFFHGAVGKGRALRPWAHRILGVAPLGSSTSAVSAASERFPRRAAMIGPALAQRLVRGHIDVDEASSPAVITPWDQARSVAATLDALGISRLELAAGGSLGGMIALCLALACPSLVARLCLIATPWASTASMIARSHLAREALRLDPVRGLSLARQIGRLSYRSEADLTARHGRRHAGPSHSAHAGWAPRIPYRVETYLRHHGDQLDMPAESLAALLGAMDHHDAGRAQPTGPSERSPSRPCPVLVAPIDSDELVSAAATDELMRALEARGHSVARRPITSPHGHDAFLIEWPQVNALLRRALSLAAAAGDFDSP